MKVTLVGAGPHDFGLLTLKGMEALQEADIVVYDRLANPRFLDLCKEDCEKIDVGKSCNSHTMPQNEINSLLLEKALLGKNVVRLKGGDPFLFGRGSEELASIIDENIPFEVISGITSAISVPSYAGIPVTDREYSSSLHIFTGHAKENHELNIDFETVAKLSGTLVFLMSLYNLAKIAEGLLQAGVNATTPTALIENGASPKQRKFIANLSEITRVAKENKVCSPMLFVVGEVCSLSEKFDWFSKKPLFQTSVLVTGHKGTSEKLEQKLRHEGAEVKMYSCIETFPTKMEVDFSVPYEWLIFSSKQGVKYFFASMMKSKIDIRKLANVKIAVVGVETAVELEKYSLYADFIPTEYNASALAKGLVDKITGRVLIVKAITASKSLTEIFQRENIQYTEIVAYETCFVENGKVDLTADYVTFTSASAVHGFVCNVGEEYLQNVTGICIGETTASVANAYNIKTFTAKEATIDAVVNLIKELKQNVATSKKN